MTSLQRIRERAMSAIKPFALLAVTVSLPACATMQSQSKHVSSANKVVSARTATPPPATSSAAPFADEQTVALVSHSEGVQPAAASAVVDCGPGNMCAPGMMCADNVCGAPGLNCGTCEPGLPPLSMKNVQEYIFDGGDEGAAVVVNKDWSQKGLGPTDTVAYYRTDGGKVCVAESNRVPIYAPRFGAVRQVTGIDLAARAAGTERILAPIVPSKFEERSGADRVVLPVAPIGQQQIGMLDAFQENRSTIPMQQIVPAGTMSEALVVFENIGFLTTGVMADHEVAVIGRILAAARSWYQPESLAVEVKGEQATIVQDSKKAQDVHVFDIPDKCSLRICKAASHTIANSGDRIRFTIRFGNVGPKAIDEVVILDSLSPRLEYIEGSQLCSIESKFTATPNEVGSQELRWEMTEKIGGSEGGVITFDCLVL